MGIAYTAKAAGLRVLSGALTNEDEARAVTFACNTTQIYSCSWGMYHTTMIFLEAKRPRHYY